MAPLIYLRRKYWTEIEIRLDASDIELLAEMVGFQRHKVDHTMTGTTWKKKSIKFSKIHDNNF